MVYFLRDSSSFMSCSCRSAYVCRFEFCDRSLQGIVDSFELLQDHDWLGNVRAFSVKSPTVRMAMDAFCCWPDWSAAQ